MLKKRFPSISSLGSDGNTSFLRAARAGNLDKVLEHLKNNIDINTCNANGLNALHLASKDGHIHVVSELLKRGALVDSATKKGNTALHIASLAGQEEVVKLLLQHNASVNVQSQNGFTPLYMAAQENHDSVVKLLLANGANQSLATEDGFTPLAVAMQQGHDKVVAVLLESDTRGKVRLPALHIAAKKDDVKAATLLLENDHNPDVTSKSGFTPLHIASHYGNEAIANLLIQKGADVNYAAKHNISPLHVAAKWGKTNMVSLLLEKGANIESKTRDGLTPLHCAARSGHEQVVDMLLERGAPISAKTKNGLAPLHMAAQGEHVDAARILLYHRAPVDEVTVDYLTALHVAAHCGHVRVAKLLLDRNADANARALNGFTPLHIACKKNRIKVVELLLKHGASISATTESGLTPLHVASFMGCMNIVIYLLQHEAKVDVPTVRGETPLHLAARANQTDIIRILLRNNAQVDARAREQQTPLHIAARLGNVDIVMLLLQHGAQVDATTKDMYTALHIAAKEGQDEVAAALIENGAALDATTKKGFTPLHLAAKYGHIKVAQLLLQKGAAIDAQGKNGVTPLHVAGHYDHQNVALLLLEKGASPHATAKNGNTPLHIAARKNQMDIATTLLEYGAKADAESKAGFTPLHLSAQEGHTDMSALLLEHKAGCDHQARNGLTPMHLCAQEDKVNVAQILLKNGADIEKTTKAGYTPLHVAAHFGQANMVRFLLQNGANVDAATGIGYTPLHQAAQQGHCHIVNLLLEHKADANAQTANGQTPLHIARKLGYISVLDSLKAITKDVTSPTQTPQVEEKYRVVAPEAMHETFMTDSEEEGDEDTVICNQHYQYLTADEMKSLGDDSLPIDVTRDERIDSNRMVQSTDSTGQPTQVQEEIITAQHAQVHSAGKPAEIYNADNIAVERHPQHVGFLVSFLVDARGGAMRGCRHSGVRIIVPARSASQPTRITCRYVKPQRTMHPPQLMEGEALASRVLELGPIGTKFLGPVIMEVPHFASLRGKEREIVILRSDNGETWREHTIDNSDEVIHDVLNECFEPEDINQLDELGGGRICRFVTYDFPQYFAVVSRIRQEVHAIGPEGGMVSSTVVPQVQAVFPQGALTKKIKVGLQAQPIEPELTAKLLGRGVAVSPIVTVEPRRRKFHKAITLSMPAPKAHSQGMINQYSGNAPTLRLLCSITGGPSRAQWEDVTGSTPLTFVNDCVSFTTTVSARFWLMDCRNISDATKMATELYREAIHVPFMAKFVVFAKRVDVNEARLRVFCMTDDKEDKTLEKQEHFTEVAKSRDVEVLEGKSQYIEMAGNLVPVTKSGDQLQLTFKAFRENRLPFNVRVKDQHADTIGRTLFMREPKVAKGEPPQQPICILNIVLPEKIIPDQISDISRSREFLTQSMHYNYLGDLRIVDISNLLGGDWDRLAPEIGFSQDEINQIKAQHPTSTAQQAQSMIRQFKMVKPNDQNILENGLRIIGRSDIIEKCMKITSYIESSRLDPSHRKHVSLENGYDEADIMKESESVEELVRQEDRRIQQMRERDELKYSAEEKIVEDSESDDENVRRSVAERREKIVKRLSIERQIPASTQKKEIVQEITEIKRKSLIEDKKAIHEEEIMLRMPIDNVVKSAVVPDQVLKLKSNKIETPDVSKSEFDKELQDKFKKTVKLRDDDEFGDEEDEKPSKITYDSTVTEKMTKTYTRDEKDDLREDEPATKPELFEKMKVKIPEKISTEEITRHDEVIFKTMKQTPSKQTAELISDEVSKKTSELSAKAEPHIPEDLKKTEDVQRKSEVSKEEPIEVKPKAAKVESDVIITEEVIKKTSEFLKAEKIVPDKPKRMEDAHKKSEISKEDSTVVKPTPAEAEKDVIITQEVIKKTGEFLKEETKMPEKVKLTEDVHKKSEISKEGDSLVKPTTVKDEVDVIVTKEIIKQTGDFLQAETKMPDKKKKMEEVPKKPEISKEDATVIKPIAAKDEIVRVKFDDTVKTTDTAQIPADAKLQSEVVKKVDIPKEHAVSKTDVPKEEVDKIDLIKTTDAFLKAEQVETDLLKTEKELPKPQEISNLAKPLAQTLEPDETHDMKQLPKEEAQQPEKGASVKPDQIPKVTSLTEEKAKTEELIKTTDSFLKAETVVRFAEVPKKEFPAKEEIVIREAFPAKEQQIPAKEQLIPAKEQQIPTKVIIKDEVVTQVTKQIQKEEITREVKFPTESTVKFENIIQTTDAFLKSETMKPIQAKKTDEISKEEGAPKKETQPTLTETIKFEEIVKKTDEFLKAETIKTEDAKKKEEVTKIEEAIKKEELSKKEDTTKVDDMVQKTIELSKKMSVNITDAVLTKGEDLENKLVEQKEKIEKHSEKTSEQFQKTTVEVVTAKTDKLIDTFIPKTYSDKPRESLTEAEFYKSIEETITKKMSEGLIQISDDILSSVSKEIPESQTPPPTPIEIQSQKDGKYESPESIPEEIEHPAHVDDVYGDHFVSEHSKEDYESARNEALTLVDSVLEQSVMIVSAQQGNDTYNSESEHYAITCDVNGIDMVKSPTIESLSGKSFDDNISVNEDSHIRMTPCTSTTILTTTTTSTFLQPTTSTSLIVDKIRNKDSNDSNDDERIAHEFECDSIQIVSSSPVHEDTNDNGYASENANNLDPIEDRKSNNESNAQSIDIDRVDKKFDRIERKFERLSSQLDDIDESAQCFDQEFDNLLSKDDISNLQSDFSKISWDESISGTTAADVGLSTPDNDLQDLPTEPASQMIQTTTATTSSTTTTDIDIPKPTPRTRKSIVNENTAEADQILEQSMESARDAHDSSTLARGETVVDGVDFKQSKKFWESLESQSQSDSHAPPPVPKPRMQVKIADDSLDSQKDSSQGSKISSEQQVEYSETSSIRTSTNEDKYSREDDSEISDARIEDEVYPSLEQDKPDSKSMEGEKLRKSGKTTHAIGEDTDDDDSEAGPKPQASFYIGESSTNIITKSTTEKRQDYAFDNKGYEENSEDETNAEASSKPKLQRAKSADESKPTYTDGPKPETEGIDDSLDGKPYVLSIDIPEAEQVPTSPSKLFRQDSETRNDLLDTSLEQEDPDAVHAQAGLNVSQKNVINTAYEAQQIFFEDQIKPIAQEVVREEVISHTTTIVEEKIVSKDDQLAMNAKLSQEKETHMKSTETKDTIPAQIRESTIDTPAADKKETRPKIEPKLDLNLDKSELEPSEKSFVKGRSEDVPTSTLPDQKTILSPIKPFKGFTTYQETADGFKKTLLIDPSQVDQSIVDQTLDEVQESLEAVEEELIEVVKDGKLIKQSPSEFEFKLLPHIKYTTDPIQESHQEEFEKPVPEEYPSISSTDDSSKSEVVHRLKKEHQKDTLNRWSIPEFDQSSSGDSHYQSFEKTDSRPLSSDIENLGTYGNSSEYQTALDASLLPESTEYVSAVSSLSHSGKTISSHESMKSFDSESSANLGSMEVSEVSETLVPSITDPDLDREIQEQDEEDFDVDDSEVKLSTLEDKFCGVLMEEFPKHDESAPSLMKRSHEMTFQSSNQKDVVDQIKVEVHQEPSEKEETQGWRYGSSLEEKLLAEEGKFASSLEEGSILSMSLSSASAIDTVVENAEDLAGSYGASSLAGVDVLIRDDYTGTSFDEPSMNEKIDNMVMTSSVGKVDETNYANTQITTVTVSTSITEATETEVKRKGHKRSESTSISSTDFLKDLAKSASTDSPIEEEPPVEKAKPAAAAPEEKRESESESDYDIYESEYSRSFKPPTVQKKSKDKRVETFEKDQEPEKRPFTPSQSISEAIIEDAAEEMETIRAEEPIRRPSQNMHDYSNIPDITVTEDLQKYSEEDDEFQDNVLYKVQTQEDLDKKGDDTPIHYAHEQIYSISEDQYQDLIERKFEPSLADITTKCVIDEDDDKADSPDSFEMLEQPDISDEFVIIEEVAKEAHEMDPEGKSISIKPTKYVKKHDDEVEQILVKSAPAAPNAGSTLYRDDLNFEFEESPPMDQDKEGDMSDSAVASKRWVEMQLSDSAAHLRYPYEMERGMLEDIKEEDAEFEVGSSRISSFKDSFSSTPEYDVLAGRKYFSRDHDNISMSSLQEFESLEQAISLENRRAHQGSQDSLSNGSFTRRYIARSAGQGDDISLSSLKEFEGLETACLEAHLIEIKAKEEAALLSRSDESNKSSNGEAKPAGSTVTTVASATSASQKTQVERIPVRSQQDIEALLRAKLDECEDETSNLMEVSADSLDLALKKPRSPTGNGNGNGKDDSQLGSCDSLEINKSGDIMTSSIDSFEISKDATARSSRSDVDSLEQQILQDVRRDSIDSIELEYALNVSKLERDSLEENIRPQSSSTTTTTTTVVQGPTQIVTRVTTTTTVSSGAQPSEMSKEFSNDSLNLNPTESEQLISSTSSLDRTSSTATNATYQNENDSLMSGSMTSCGSNTMIDTLDNFMDTFQGSSSSMTSSTTTTSQMTICDERTMHQQFHQQTQQHQQYIKDGEKRYEYFEIFEKDSDKETQRVKKASEDGQKPQGPDEQKK